MSILNLSPYVSQNGFVVYPCGSFSTSEIMYCASNCRRSSSAVVPKRLDRIASGVSWCLSSAGNASRKELSASGVVYSSYR